ncbi:MAG: PIG-L family deacetylase, partial [Lachnospiraceae bacterium]|nr:PIG-L family deacetylase [Lachnospiraceae bacterium]
MRCLVVAAHPDDEILGAGATMRKMAKEGQGIYVCLLSHWSPTRDDNLEDGIAASHSALGVKKSYIGDFGCMRFKD